MKRVMIFFLLFLYVLGTLGALGYLLYDGCWHIAIGVVVTAYLAYFKARELFKEL